MTERACPDRPRAAGLAAVTASGTTAPETPASTTPGMPEAAAFGLVAPFLRAELPARALAFAFDRGLVDRLADAPLPVAGLAGAFGLLPRGAEMLVALLQAGGVVEEATEGDGEGTAPAARLALTAAFREALRARDLLEAQLAFCLAVAGDLRTLFPAFVSDLPGFMAQARTFELFRYDRCAEITPETLALARRWVGYTTCLTRYEAGPALALIDPSRSRRMLDIGGNSGEFAARACARAPRLRATVVDRPVVCALGRENLAGRPEAERVRFAPLDMREDPLPEGHDLVTFKSVLHDWPDADAERLLGRAAAVLAPHGRLVIFERAPPRLAGRGGCAADFAATGNLVFLHFFREVDLYVDCLHRLGFTDVAVRTLILDTAFHLVEARAPGGGACA